MVFFRKGTSSSDTNKVHSKWLKIAFPLVIATLIIVLAVVCVNVFIITGTGDRVFYSPDGLYAYIVDGKGAYFISGQSFRAFEGDVFFGQTTPDQSRYILLYNDRHLVTYEGVTETEIASDVQQVRAVNNKGCFYMKGEHPHLWYYDFASGENIDVGFEDMTLYFSSGMTSLVAIDENIDMFMFSCTDKKARLLCNLGKDDDGEICCVADNGSNVIWSRKSGNEFSIYTLINDVPERIGRLTNLRKYSSIYAKYFDDDLSFVVYSPGSKQILLSNKGEIVEVSLPGVLGYEDMVSLSGLPIDSDDDRIETVLLFVRKNWDTDEGSIYRMTMDGELFLEIEGAYLEEANLNGNDCLIIVDGYLYFLNKDHDLLRKRLGRDSIEPITTNVEAFSISPTGTYAYICKSGGLYYWEISDKSMQLNLITSGFENDNIFYLSNRDDTVFYIQSREKIKNTYLYKGDAYQVNIGETPRLLMKDTLKILYTGDRYISSNSPLISVYESTNEEDEIIRSFWLEENGMFEKVFVNGHMSSCFSTIGED